MTANRSGVPHRISAVEERCAPLRIQKKRYGIHGRGEKGGVILVLEGDG